MDDLHKLKMIATYMDMKSLATEISELIGQSELATKYPPIAMRLPWLMLSCMTYTDDREFISEDNFDALNESGAIDKIVIGTYEHMHGLFVKELELLAKRN